MSRQYQSVPPNQSFGQVEPSSFVRNTSLTAPLCRRSNPGPSSGPPPSFKTNVNRAKTKRWVEAKSYSYDGDDWGEADEYDEYGNYDDEPQHAPPPFDRPTDLRQQGQSTVPGAPGYLHHGRNNSFDEGEEKRQFSTGAPPPPQQQQQHPEIGRPQSRPGQYPPVNFSPNYNGVDGRLPPAQVFPDNAGTGQRPPYNPPSTQPQARSSFDGPPGSTVVQHGRPSFDSQSGPSPGPPFYAHGRPSIDTQQRPVHPPSYPPSANYRGPSYSDSRSQSMTSTSSSLDFQGRRDFSPTAMPPPLSTRGSPAPPGMPHPPRKSSLSQVNPPPEFSPTQQDSTLSAHQSDLPQPRSDRADSASSNKPLPFVRPADIYRRMQEEREKERKSQDSSRPSMDGILRDQPPIPEKPVQDFDNTSEAPLNSEVQGKGLSQPSSEASGRRNLLPLDSITERSPHGSPLLPEVSRLSGFGESFLGSTSLDDPPPDLPIGVSKTPTGNDTLATTTTDLQHQNSLGFRSVVHQAFDRPEDLNAVSPMSASDSNIARTNSESTNAISPIISRASSSAHPEAKARDDAGHETSIPSIIEEPSESPLRPSSIEAPSTPKGGRERSETQIYAPRTDEALPPAFKPGHRRDMSTPSPDNSPARTPALETTQVAQPQNVELATTTPVEPQNRGKFSGFGIPLDQQGPPQASGVSNTWAGSPSTGKVRDIVGRLESPTRERQATEDSNELTQARPMNNRFESFRPQLPGGWDSYSNPRSSQPQKALTNPTSALALDQDPFVDKPVGAIAQNKQRVSSEVDTVAGGDAIGKVKDDPQPSDPFANVTAAGSALANAFVSAVGAKEHTNSESESESEKHTAPISRSRANTELHPEASRLLPSNPDESPISSIAPTPLAKDTPMETPRTGHPDYFPPVVPLKQKPRGSVSPDFDTPNRIHSNVLPSLSTENSPQDYESDRLRKELVRELSPSSSQFDRSGGSIPPAGSRPDSTQVGHSTQGHESMALPQEYDSYWNDSNSIEPTSRPTSNANPMINEPRSVDEYEGHQPGSLSSPDGNNAVHQSSNRLQVQQPELVHRFSWEELPEKISTSREASAEPTFPSRIDSDMKDLPPSPRPESVDSSVRPTSFGSDLAAAKLATAPENDSPLSKTFSQELAKANTHLETPHPTDSNLSSSTLLQASDERRSGDPADPVSKPAVDSLPPMRSEPGKVAAFREIMAMKSSAERVNSFNETRKQFAAMNTGLSNWIAATLNDLPEHSNLLENGGRFTVEGQRPSASRGKLAGLRVPNTQTQQPYYQQYLDASGLSPTATSTPSKQGQNSSPIYTPASSGSKLTTRQVQAKGKDLLHGAGVFGGKANVVAKGLFSKGKSKFRGSDKALPPTPRAEPRSPRFSFGMPARSSVPPPPMPKTPTTAETDSGEVAPDSTRSISSKKQDGPPVHEPQVESSRLSQDVFALPPSNLLDMPAPATPPLGTSNLDGVENDAGLLSPASPSSSNRTPTLSSFRKNSWAHEQLPLTPLQKFRNMSQSQGDAKALPLPPNEMEEPILELSPPDLPRAETPPAVPVHTVPMPGREDSNIPQFRASGMSKATANLDSYDETQMPILNTAPISRVMESHASPRMSEDSEGTFRTAESGDPHGLGVEEVPTPLAKDSTRPSIDGSAVSEMSNPVGYNASQVEQPVNGPADRTPSPVSTPRPFSFIQFGEHQRPSEGLSYGAGFENEISSQQRQSETPLPISPISPRQAPIQEPAQSLDPAQDLQNTDRQTFQALGNPSISGQAAPVHHDTSHDFGPQDQNFTKKPRPRSFSRPFQDQSSRVRQESRGSREAERKLSAEIASPFYIMQSPTGIAQPPKEQQSEPNPNAERPSIANVDPRQKRSRTSGIFKSFSISPKEPLQAENPSTPRKSVDHSASTALSVEKKSRRGKLLRTLTGRSNSDSNNSKDEVPALPKLRTDVGQEGFSHSNGRRVGVEGLHEDVSNSNRKNKSQRASTSGVAGETGGKKRRFSGFGSLFNQSKQRQSSVPTTAESAYPWAPQQQQTVPPATSSFRPPHSRQGSSAYQESRQPLATPQVPAPYSQPTSDVPSQQEYPPPSQTMYDRPPLEGYYSPDRRSGNFSPAFMSGQRSPRLGPQQFSPQRQSQDYVRPPQASSPTDLRRQNRISWQEALPPASMNSPMYNSTSPNPPASQPYSQQPTQRINSFGSVADPLPSWTRTPGQNNVPPLPPLSPPHSGPTSEANKQPTYQPRSSSMNYSLYPSPSTSSSSKRNTLSTARGLHEIDSASQHAPRPYPVGDDGPPPPPKDSSNSTINKPRTSADFHPRHPAYQPHNQSNATQALSTQAPAQTQPTDTNGFRQQNLPSLQTNFSDSTPEISRNDTKQLTPEEVRRARQTEIEREIGSPRIGSGDGTSENLARNSPGAEELKFRMQGSSYPGQEWTPGYGNWDGN